MLSWWSNLRLHVQIIVVSAVLLALTISVAAWFNFQSQKATLLENTRREALALSANLALMSSYPIIIDALDQLEELLVKLASLPQIGSIKVTTLEGKPLSYVKKTAAGEVIVDFALAPERIPDYGEHTNADWVKVGESVIAVWQPVETSVLLAWIKIEFKLDNLLKLQHEAIVNNVVGAIIAIAFDFITLLMILYFPARNFKKAIDFADRLSDFPGKTYPLIGGSAEINVLISALNRSSEKLAAQNEILIQQQQESFQQILQTNPNGLLVVDDCGRIEIVNHAAEAMFGYPAGAMSGIQVEDLVPAPVRARHPALRKKFMTDKQRRMSPKRSVTAVRRDNTEFPVEISLGSIHQNARDFTIATIEDITEKIQLQKQLQHSQKMESVGVLTGGIAHDFNNSLTVIKGMTELAIELHDKNMPERVRGYLENVLTASKHAAEVVQKLLTYSRGTQGMTGETDAVLLARETISLMSSTLPSSIRIVVDLENGLPAVRINPDNLQQVLTNLMLNARDAMAGRGVMKIRIASRVCSDGFCSACGKPVQGEYVELAVHDDGAGVRKEDLGRLFEPFFTTKEKGINKGTGLGLSMSMTLVHEVGGHIVVEAGATRGTTFRLLLPLAKGRRG